MSPEAFVLKSPKQRRTSVVFASPHSGRVYPQEFLSAVEPDALLIRSSEDAFVDLLFADAPDLGAPLLLAEAPRAFVDLNRAVDELDPALIEGVRRVSHNPRVVSGLGVIPRVVANGRAIYRGKITMAEAHGRLRDYWHPYHDRLQALIDESHAMFGEAILVDCHSMPREALGITALGGGQRPDVVLGDRFGAAANSRLVDQIESAFVMAGFKVARNSPFAGAFSTQAYGRPSRRQHAIQVEIDRSLYMNEATLEPLPEFDQVRLRLRQVMSRIVDIGASQMPLAAE